MVEVLPLRDDRLGIYAEAVEAYLVAAGIGVSSERIYRISLTTCAWLAAGEQLPPAPTRRSASPPGIAFAALASAAAANVLAEAFGWVALGARLTVPGNEPQGLLVTDQPMQADRPQKGLSC